MWTTQGPPRFRAPEQPQPEKDETNDTGRSEQRERRGGGGGLLWSFHAKTREQPHAAGAPGDPEHLNVMYGEAGTCGDEERRRDRNGPPLNTEEGGGPR